MAKPRGKARICTAQVTCDGSDVFGNDVCYKCRKALEKRAKVRADKQVEQARNVA